MIDNYDIWEAEELRREKAWEAMPECEKCHDKFGEYYYDTPEGKLCYECAWMLAEAIAKEEMPGAADETVWEAADAYVEEWEESNDGF